MKNVNWTALLILGSLPAILLVCVVLSTIEDNSCKKIGGKPTRIGCLDPKVFIK